jgi:hypothetical protein
MVWFLIYLLNILWTMAGTNTQTRSSCCEYGACSRVTMRRGKERSQTLRSTNENELKLAITIGVPKWVSWGVSGCCSILT